MVINNLTNILNIILAARIWKNLPLLFIYLSGLMIGVEKPDLKVIIISLVGISFSSVFMTHLNILTDRNLDLIEKPHLYKMLSSNPTVMKGAFILEGFITLISILLLVFFDFYLTALFIFTFTIVTILYSYNFFSKNPEINRFKVFWHGHFFVLISGYLSLWYAGFFSGTNTENAFNWMLVFLSMSLSEYALFLFESAIDRKAEKMSKIKTIAAVFGRKISTYFSILLSFFSIILLTIVYFLSNKNNIIIYSFLPVIVFIFLFLFTVSLKRLYKKEETFKVPDLIFNFGRIYILLSKIYIKHML